MDRRPFLDWLQRQINDMKRKEKTVVPPREKRLAEIGDAKAPKMGGITPKTVCVPEVDDILGEMKQFSADQACREIWSFGSPFEFVSFDLASAEGDRSVVDRCNHGCSCDPCRHGNCGACLVDAQRNADRQTVRAFVAEFRGVKLP
jgi:hypothetical protein